MPDEEDFLGLLFRLSVPDVQAVAWVPQNKHDERPVADCASTADGWW